MTRADVIRTMIRIERELLEILEAEVERTTSLESDLQAQRWRSEKLTGLVDEMRAEARGGVDDEF